MERAEDVERGSIEGSLKARSQIEDWNLDRRFGERKGTVVPDEVRAVGVAAQGTMKSNSGQCDIPNYPRHSWWAFVA